MKLKDKKEPENQESRKRESLPLLPTNKDYISFTEFDVATECTWKHKIVYKDKNYEPQNEYGAFGTAIHSTCEKLIHDENFDYLTYFKKQFKEELKEVDLSTVDKQVVIDMFIKGPTIFEDFWPFMKKEFGKFEVLEVEIRFKEPIPDMEDLQPVKFKGFIDLVIKTEDGVIHVIDYKTSKKGWHRLKKGKKNTAYQIVIYKDYYCQKYGVDPKNVKTHFIILKWMNVRSKIALYTVTSGPKRVKNSRKAVKAVLRNIINETYVKNRTSCKFCKFYKTDKCR